MNLFKFIIISSFINIFVLNEKLKIANISNPLFLNGENSNLVFVFNHMKHGASSPCYGLNEQYEDIFGQQWNGDCELTQKGFLQMFKLGKIYQQRYNKLLSISSNPDINLVLSFASKENKALMTSNAFFYGMYFNNDTPIEERFVIPTRNFKKKNDTDLIPIFYFGDINNCEGWKNLVDKIDINQIKELNDFMSKFLKNYENVFNSLKNKEQIYNAGNSFDKINLFCSSYISNYYDERYKNIKLFQEIGFTEDKFYDLYSDCHLFNLYKYILIQYNNEAKNIPASILSDPLKDMIKYMDYVINSPEEESPKFISYTGHDSTIAAFQVILNKLFNVPFKLMNFGSNQIFLLFKNEQNYEIKYLYNDELLLNINYEEFKKKISNYIKSDERDLIYFCQGFKFKDYTFLVLFCTIIALLVANISICLYNKNIFCEKKKYMSIESSGKSIEVRNEIYFK